MSKNRPILILGGTGFIGHAVVSQLLRERNPEDLIVLSHRKASSFAGVKTIKGSLEKVDWSQLDHNPPETIIHLARINATRFGKLGRYLAARKGRNANKRLVEHSQRANWRCSFTYVSGSLMYGEHGTETILEGEGLKPIAFARQYSIAEDVFDPVAQNVRVIRVPWVIGQGSWFKGFFTDKLQSEKRVPQYGSGENWMSFIEVSDAAKGIVYASLNFNRGVYHLAMPQALPQRNFCELISKLSGFPIKAFSNTEMEMKFEEAIVESFRSNIILGTRFQENFPANFFQFTEVESALKHHLSLFLKDKERILS
ncbi:MAG: NAD(P)-dependent oxidoreductase [Bacteroidetes bacterium]|nr:MAG: NAD(P)-dependent oxidoreductase [Bacteroidota bacterium]